MSLKYCSLTLAFFIALGFSAVKAQNISQQVVSNRTNSLAQQKKPYVIYISADGFRHDYAVKYNAKNILKLSSNGVAAKHMQPSFPSVTFANHYTLATGMYPSNHGIVNNVFYNPTKKETYVKTNPNSISDSTWYGGVPIWALAEQQNMVSAAFYWIGSETAVGGVRPTYWYNYNTLISLDDRLKAVKEWLNLPEDKRPHLINFYLPEVDVAGHHYGVQSKEIETAVHLVDDCIGKLVALAEEVGLDVNFVFVSDHGMLNIDASKGLALPAEIDLNKFIVPAGDALLHVYARNKADVDDLYNTLKLSAVNYDVYKANKMPKRWKINAKNDKEGRLGDLILVAKYPYFFNITKRPPTIGKHGFDNALEDMQAVFYAWGPAFKQGLTINSFSNVHVYPLIAKLLDLKIDHKIDGKLKVLKPILK